MTEVFAFAAGGYRYLKGVFQYSAAVAAEPGFEIERARFRRPVALDEGFRAVEAHLRTCGRPLTAFCACELRSPAPFTEAGFEAFNRQYVGEMERRMRALDFGWKDATDTQLYTVHDVHPLYAEEILSRSAAPGGLTLHYARPPVVDLEFEMDVRGVSRELVI